MKAIIKLIKPPIHTLTAATTKATKLVMNVVMAMTSPVNAKTDKQPISSYPIYLVHRQNFALLFLKNFIRDYAVTHNQFPPQLNNLPG